MTNTIPNVPRELLERHLKTVEGHLAITLEGELAQSVGELRAILSATSPAGVDGWDVAGDILEKLSDAQAIIDGLMGELLDASAERNSVQRERDAYKLLLDRECNDADSMLMTLGIEPDEIRTEGGFLMVAHIVSCISVQRDRQAQRIGDLASHLEFAVTMLTVAGLDKNAQVEAMRASLSAGKEGE